ncbi:hypothetical protein WDM22_44485 (plasmid) [Bradyrhizobium septentrionale]|uniref:hypothetical protein n=1 Tax=Bradyrhizobium septentrionale TaxID=1404411 RepID=UPI0030D5D9CA
MITAENNDQQPTREANQIAGDLAKGQQLTEQKLFGINPAILIPAIISAARAVIKGQQPSEFDESLRGDAIQIAGDLAKGQQLTEQKLFGINPAILIPAIISAARAVIKGQQPNEFDESLRGDAIQIAGDLAKGQQLTEQKLFGINPAILIPAIISAARAVIKGQQPNEFDESLRGDAIQIAGDLAKGQQLTEQKLFGINPAILIPAIISAARAVIKGQQPNEFDESLRGDAIQIAGDLAKGQQLTEQKLFGINPAILIPAIISAARAVIKGQQPNEFDESLRGDAIQIAGDLAKGQQLTEQKLFGVNPAILIPAIISAARAVIKGQQPNEFDESLRGDAIQIAGDLAKGQQLTEQKLFGINPAILIPAIISAARAVIKGQQPNEFDESLRGDAIQIAGDLAKGQQLTEQKLFGINPAILIPAIISAARAVIKGQQPAARQSG